MRLRHILILQNKIDLVKESQAKEQQEQILKFIQGQFFKLKVLESSQITFLSVVSQCHFVKVNRKRSTANVFGFAGTIAEGAPIIPISAQLKYNVDAVCEYLTKKIPVPERDFTSKPRLIGAYCNLICHVICFWCSDG